MSNQQQLQQIPEEAIRYDLQVKISMAIFASALDVESHNAKTKGIELDINHLPSADDPVRQQPFTQ